MKDLLTATTTSTRSLFFSFRQLVYPSAASACQDIFNFSLRSEMQLLLLKVLLQSQVPFNLEKSTKERREQIFPCFMSKSSDIMWRHMSRRHKCKWTSPSGFPLPKTDTVNSLFIARALIKTWTFLVAKLQIILSKKWMNLRNKNNKCYQFLFSWLIAIVL